VNAGRLVHQRACGRPVGTRIDVEHLFEPVPARRKFLKSDRTEAGHIVNCVRLYALACPATSFALYEDGREVFSSPECSSLADRVGEIFGRQAAEGLLALDYADSDMRLSGLIGRPGVGRATRHDMVAFVNSRPVDSRTVNGALMESYRESVPQGRYPVAFVFLECRPSEVDVNVHPAKREVRFRSEAAVRGFIIRAVLSRLREFSGSPDAVAGAAGSSRGPDRLSGGAAGALPRMGR
jgi:DNA mismatch repair protein MutL